MSFVLFLHALLNVYQYENQKIGILKKGLANAAKIVVLLKCVFEIGTVNVVAAEAKLICY